ncbi:integrator complex subunit 5 [Ischnura elegans]|uniref:integrator complex subunit 5 n=1 Tax=Ischnura elegans TaxID=197161 RepID=UPI001ED8B483|nr:integrator complex subunit 5 [Ischnura elegans]
MAGTSVIKAVPQQDSLSELRTFVAGATRTVKTNPLELARTALSLLKTLPSTIDAVLEYFCALFDVAVAKYVSQIESDMCSGGSSAPPVSTHEEATIAEIHSVLCSCVTSSPEAWVPIISKWSLELLGELSSKYAGRAHVHITAGLNETLQLWMSCRATRTLIDITTQCLSCRVLSDTETCINSLLDTSVVHSPHFDWVVAHVGSCFPHTVITRVLSCGLKDFCHHASSSFAISGTGVGKDATSEGGPTGTPSVIAAPKVNSVVGILGHLAGSHFKDIRTALLDLFKWSLEEEDETFAVGVNLEAEEGVAHRIATVPFLLHLASLSPMLLRALTTDVLQTLTPSMLPRLAHLSPAWCRFFGGRQALQDLVVHLALGCERGGTQILRLLIDAATSQPANDSNVPPSVSSQVRENCAEILELLLQEIDVLVRSGASAATCPSPGPAGGGLSGGISLGGGNERWVPILSSVCHEVSAIRPLLLAGGGDEETPSSELVSRTGVRLVSLLASAHLGPSLAAEAAAFLLRRATNNFQLATFLQLLRHTQASHPTLATDTLRRVLDCLPGDGMDDDGGFTGKDEPPLRFWLNLYALLKYEASETLRRTRQSGQVSGKNRPRSHPYGGDHVPHRPILDAVRAVLPDVTTSLCTSRSIAMRHAAALVLERALPLAKEVSAMSIFSSPELSLKVARAAVVHFFLSAAEQELEVEIKDFQEAALSGITVSGTSGCRVACRILSKLVPISSAARALALRDLLEGALVHQETATLFGAKLAAEGSNSYLNQLANKGKSPLSRAVLLWENGRPRTALPRRHSSVFLVADGDLSKGTKSVPKPPREEVVALNIQMLVEAVKCCCSDTKVNPAKEPEIDSANNSQTTYGTNPISTTGSVSLDAISMVSLLLVEIVSPDVMYNGLPWPEEEFCKVTIERDLQIRRTFERLPVLWALLTLAATHRPALCYCSVLLRAIMATLLAQWNSHTTATTTAISNSSSRPPPPPSLLANTQRLIDLMALGQLLPSPLSAIRDVIPKIGPREVVALLRDIWNYTHENIPSPALFSQDAGSGLVWRQGMGPGAEEVEGGEVSSARPSSRHTDALRHTLQLHIDSLGTLYPRLFSLTAKTVLSSPASPNPEDSGKTTVQFFS